MHEYVKKALVTALLIVYAAFVPCLPMVAGFPDRTSGLARAAANQLFWQIWDKQPNREIEDWIPTHSDACQESEWNPGISPAYSFRLTSNPNLKDPYPPRGNMTGSWYRFACA